MIVDIEGIDPRGDGAAYALVAGRRLLVDFALPGERVEVSGADTGVAAVDRVLRPSPHRVAPRCPYFGTCGGCMWQHIAYDEQLRLKQGMLRALLRRSLGGAAPAVRSALSGLAEPWGYRNKVHFVFAPASPRGGLVMGHYRRHAMSVVAVEECPVHAAEGNRVAFAVRDALVAARLTAATPGAGQSRGLVRHIVVRSTRSPAETLATLVVTRNDKALRPAVRRVVEGESSPSGLHLNVHDRPGPYLFGRETLRLHGRDRAREVIDDVSFLVSPTAFFQTNVVAAAAMVRLVLDHALPATTALDLYAGAGLFALPLARRGTRVTAVEENPQAVDDGEASRSLNRIADLQSRFVRARVEDIIDGSRRRLIPASPDVVVLDPPRSGCPHAVLDWICRTVHPARMVYVSCNPEALAADLPVALAAGYRARLIQPVDMFPHTPHIETVAVLARG